MKELFACLTVLSLVAFASLYIYKIRHGTINPSIATWIIFTVGTSLSLTTYAIAAKRDFISGILNTADVGVCISILFATIIWGKREIYFGVFEKSYLVAVAIVVAYGLITGDAWTSNVFSQAVISSGFLPMLKKMFTKKRNTESFTAWSFNVIAPLIALYPALVDGKDLAALYAVRTLTLTLITMAVMAYYEFWRKNETHT